MKHNTLSNDVISYIEDNLEKKKIIEDLVIKIKTNDDVDEDHIKKVLNNYIEDKIELNERHRKNNKLKQIRLFIIGLIFIILSIIVGKTLDTILYTIISTIGSFAIWEAADIWIVENMDSKIRDRKLKSLLNSKIEIVRK